MMDGNTKKQRSPFSVLRRWTRAAAVVVVGVVAAACGSSDDDNGIHRFVVFGDSTSDMGTHQVSFVAAVGGGRYTVNPGPVWTERVAQSLGLPMTVGLHGGVSTATQVCPLPPNCTNWAVGGGRVTLHPGIREEADGSGQLAATIKEQIAYHLARFNGKFDNNDLVSIQGGYNDLFYQLGVFAAMLQGGATADQALAAVVTAMATAGGELAGYVKTDILGKGARYVIVQNMSNLAASPYGVASGAQVQALITAMTGAFNAQLAAGLAGSNAKLFDFAATTTQWASNPGAVGITNIANPACSAAKIAAATGGLIQDGASLFCTGLTLVDGDTSKWFYADDVHPAPYGHQLIAEAFLAETRRHGWR